MMSVLVHLLGGWYVGKLSKVVVLSGGVARYAPAFFVLCVAVAGEAHEEVEAPMCSYLKTCAFHRVAKDSAATAAASSVLSVAWV